MGKSKNSSIIFLYSIHNGNTRKVAEAIAPVINASIIDIGAAQPAAADFKALEDYALIGFGSGIDSARHFRELLNLAENLPRCQNKKAFIFSTSGIYSEKKMLKDHETLRNILHGKGFIIVGEFGCPGYNTNSILKFFGGMNKKRPSPDDLSKAAAFAKNKLLSSNA
jgi:flavodoxin